MILILQDKKGFRKEVYHYCMPPVYEIAEYDGFNSILSEGMAATATVVTGRTRRFYPYGDSTTYAGENIQFYRER